MIYFVLGFSIAMFLTGLISLKDIDPFSISPDDIEICYKYGSDKKTCQRLADDYLGKFNQGDE